MYTVQKEMLTLKEKIADEELKRRRDEELRILETERDWFRNEALRLDKICKEYKRSMEIWKNKALTLQEDRKFMENQILNTKKQNMKMKEQLESRDNFSSVSNQNSFARSEKEVNYKQLSVSPIKPDHKSNEQRYLKTIKHLQNQLEAQKKTLQLQKSASANYLLEKGELEDFFIQCIEIVRKEVVRRKQSNKRIARSFSSKSLRNQKPKAEEVKLESFTHNDKKKVMELFVSSEEVLSQIQQKIFPPAKKRPPTASAASLGTQNSSTNQMQTLHGFSKHVFSVPSFKNKKGLIRPSSSPKYYS